MFKPRIVATAALMALCLGTAQAAPVSLFDFSAETPLAVPSFGTSSGTVFIEGASGLDNLSGVTPLYGPNQLVLDTYFGVDTRAAGVVSSWFYSFTATAGTSYGFSYNFLTNQVGDVADDDKFIVSLTDSLGATDTLVTETALMSVLVDGGPLAKQTGFKTISFTADTSGAYSIQFLVSTMQLGCATGDLCVPTFAVVNGLEPAVGTIPEPTSLALVGLALMAGVSLRRRA